MSQTSASTCEALTGAAPCFPSRNILGCVCGPVPPSDEDSGSARTTCTLPQERVGALDVIPVAGGVGAGAEWGYRHPEHCGLRLRVWAQRSDCMGLKPGSTAH